MKGDLTAFQKAKLLPKLYDLFFVFRRNRSKFFKLFPAFPTGQGNAPGLAQPGPGGEVLRFAAGAGIDFVHNFVARFSLLVTRRQKPVGHPVGNKQRETSNQQRIQKSISSSFFKPSLMGPIVATVISAAALAKEARIPAH